MSEWHDEFCPMNGCRCKKCPCGHFSECPGGEHYAVTQQDSGRPYKTRCSCGEWNYDHAAHLRRVTAGAKG